MGRQEDMPNKTDLTQIPGIGKKMAEHLINAGYPDIESLKGQDPEEIYTKHRLLQRAGNQSCGNSAIQRKRNNQTIDL